MKKLLIHIRYFRLMGKTIARTRWSESESAIELWDPHIGQLKRTLIGNPEGLRFVDSIAFSPVGDTLAVARGREIVFLGS